MRTGPGIFSGVRDPALKPDFWVEKFGFRVPGRVIKFRSDEKAGHFCGYFIDNERGFEVQTLNLLSSMFTVNIVFENLQNYRF